MDDSPWLRKTQDCLSSLAKKLRIIGCVMCLLAGSFCVFVAGLFVGQVSESSGFALFYAIGSVFFITSFSILWGPVNHIKHLLSAKTRPFTTIYIGTMFGILCSSLWLTSPVLTVIFVLLQIGTLVMYIMKGIPGGQTGIFELCNTVSSNTEHSSEGPGRPLFTSRKHSVAPGVAQLCRPVENDAVSTPTDCD